jgi:D-serine deaminase-like pyridoxal phosphate-dependent protein
MHVEDLDTPAAFVDLDIMESNLRRCQSYLDGAGIALRPHIKTHKIPEFAHLQLKLGAKGITCQKLGEAEVMVDAGVNDILLTYNIVGPLKLARLAVLAQRGDLKVCADSVDVVEGLSHAMDRAGLKLPVLVECDTGMHRCGVATPADAVALAEKIARSPGLRFAGLMTYPAFGGVGAAATWLAEAVDLCRNHGLEAEIVSNGGTPDLYRAHEVTVATEHRPGTYIYSDRSLVEGRHFGTLEDCALRVQATVVSHPAPDRCIIDAGSKSLSSDLLGMTGHGRIVEHPEWQILRLSEEHGHVGVPPGSASPRIGERVNIIPNHACVVSNLHGRIYAGRRGQIEASYDVAARGRMQ